MSIVSDNAEKNFPSHTNIGMEVEAIVHSNAMFDPHQHSRVSLNQLILDLIKYRDSLPTIEEYAQSGRL
tara:strand:+ start:281 stop:487 length:207 start_codon:yes stop_codon:yes gene_type:complete